MSDVRDPSSEEHPTAVSAPGVPANDDVQDVFVFPASSSQQRLWFLDALEPGSPVYNIHAAIRLTGPLDVDALDAGFQTVVARHESLRTSFVVAEGKPLQVIAEEHTFEIPVDDLRSLDEASREVEIRKRAREEARTPFDLSACPLARARLLLVGDEEHVLLLTVHHIVADGWSMGIIYRDLSTCYAAELNGASPELPELEIQYVDYAMWQAEFIASDDVKTQLSFWLESFGDDLPVLDLPTKGVRPAHRSSVGRTEWLKLDRALVERSVAFCRAEQLTRFMLHLAALSVLFHKCSGQDEVIVGSPAANRDRPEVENCVGFFANTVAFRTDLSGGPTFRELLRKVHEFSLRVYANQDVPFESIVEALNPSRDLSHTPLFQVMFAMQPTPDELLQLPGIDAEFMEVDNGTSKFDLHIEFQETSDGVQGSFQYSTELFDAEGIRVMIEDYEDLLRQLIDDPDRSIDEVRLRSLAGAGVGSRPVAPVVETVDTTPLTDEERDQVLVEWNRTEREFERDVSIHELLERQVERTPEATALTLGAERLTYRELNSRANRLAHYLRERGVGPEVLVGLCVERTTEMVVGVLGILKAGGAYVPLDPEYPRERLAFMLEDTRAPVLLTQDALTGSLPDHAAEVIRLDADWPAIRRCSDQNPAAVAKPDNLAYVIYTSGSTGRPKGVAIEHRSAGALIHWAHDVFSPEELAGVLFSTSICFDLSVFELFVPLSRGGSVIIADNALHLPTLPAKDEVTLINSVPSAMTELLRAGHLPASVKTVNLAGERLAESLVDRIYEEPSVERVYDLYGPSEDTTYSTFALRRAGGPYTIGRPIANTQVYLLDEHREPVRVGAPGELYLGGAGLARGYLHRPELTAEKFVRHPFSSEPGARLYRTGDLARYLPGGNIEYLGRIDHQVKIRGFRIELGEIEAALGELPAVSETVVVAREDTPGEKRLVAYLVAAESAGPPTPTELRESLRSKLPKHMVPSAFVFMDRLPLTPNGKVDRRALPAPDDSREGWAGEYVAPRTEIEAKLAAVWAKALKLDRVGVTDNFFELGGHSLLAVGMMAEIEKSFAIDVPLATLFRASTVEKFAALLDGDSRREPVEGDERRLASERDHICLVPMQPDGTKAPLYFVHGVGGNVLYFSDLIRRLGKDQPCYGLQAKGVDGKTTPHSTVTEMAAFYIREVQDVQPAGPYFLCGFSSGGVIAFEMARQLLAAGERVALLALLDTPHPDYYGVGRRREARSRHGRKGIFASLKARGRLLRGRLREKVQNARIRWYKRRGRPIPASLRPQHLAAHFFEALKQHNAGDYAGEVVLFRTGAELDATGTDMGWGAHAGEGVKVIEFDGGHGAFLREPQVEEFSQILKRVIGERTGA